MKPNKRLIANDRAQAGIGTLIIFIAMVLVAAVAAAVLISTSGILQQKAQKTGTETISEVSSNLKIISIVGDRGASLSSYFNYVNITIETAAGAGKIDLNQVKLELSNGTAVSSNITYSSTWPTGATTFYVTMLRDPMSVFSATNPIVSSGSLDIITAYPGSATPAVTFLPRSSFKFSIIPESGTPIIIEGTTPSSYGIDRYVVIQ